MNMLKRRFAAALLLAAGVAAGPAGAQESGFVLEDSIRRQIFAELRDNVNALYRNSLEETRKAAPAYDELEKLNADPAVAEANEREARKPSRRDRFETGKAL